MNRKMYLALDFPTWEETKGFINLHKLHGVPVKVGMELFYREGPELIEKLKQSNHAIFLDLKLHDIPTTVMKAMRNIAKLEVDMVNVHALGGSEMIQQAKEGLISGSISNHKTKLIAVTMLTSMDENVMNKELKIQGNVQDSTVRLSNFAQRNGADGVVCSVHEVKQIKAVCGPSFMTVTPGIRQSASPNDDQKRVATPLSARENGADFLVLGRTVTNAESPKKAYQKIEKEWKYGN